MVALIWRERVLLPLSKTSTQKPRPNKNHPNTTKTAALSLVDVDAASDPALCPPRSGHVDCRGMALSLDTTKVPDGRYNLFMRVDSFLSDADPVIVSC